MVPTQGDQGLAPPQGGLPNQDLAPLQGDQPNHGVAPLQGGQSDQGMAPPQGSQPAQGMALSVGGQSEGMSEDHRKIQKEMFQLAMENQWDAVEINYKAYPFTQEAKITSSEGTILHVAVMISNKLSTVKKLVAAVTDKRILEMVNNRGNTALHLAAAMGKVSMCKCMVEKHQLFITGEHNPNDKQPLIAKRNEDGETPLFLAALHGKKDAFLYLHSKCPPTHGSEYLRRKDGNNILHAAIVGEYFDLAYQIIKKYKALDLVNPVNERGQSVLHLLASNPSAFESGSHLGRLERLIYHCIVVNQLKETMYSDSTIDEEYQREDILPKNYATCMQFYLLLRRMFRFSLGGPRQLWSRWWRCPPCQRDEENQRNVKSGLTGGDGSTSRNNQSGGSRNNHEHPLPPNYITCYDFFDLALVLLQVLGLGFISTYEIKEMKQKHTWAAQIMRELVSQASSWEYHAPDSRLGLSMAGAEPIGKNEAIPFPGNDSHEEYGRKEKQGEKMAEILQKILNIFPTTVEEQRRYGKNAMMMKVENTQPHMYKLIMEMMKENKDDGGWMETPFLVAAKMGVVEMVEEIHEKFPVAIRDVNQDGKNALHLAMENRKHKVFKFMSSHKDFWDHVKDVDNDGNTALHLAVTLGKSQPWLTPSAVLQMQLDLKWYKIVSKAMPNHLIARRNYKGLTAKEVFTETHKDMVREGAAQLTSISNSCSVVAALIATVAFATAATIPGGFRTEDGTPTFEGKNAFDIFTGCSLIALCLSIISLITFLAILIYPYQESDFGNYLPKKLLIGFTALLLSIAFIFVSFCASHFFLLRDNLHYAAYPVYATICFSITFFSIFQFPLYFDLIKSTIKSTPPDY